MMSEKMAMVLMNAFWFACMFWAVMLSLSVWYDHKSYKDKGSFCKTIVLIMGLLVLGVATLVFMAYNRYGGNV